MESHIPLPYLREVTIFLVIAGLVVPILQRRISPVLAYLMIGGVIGPFGLGLLAADIAILKTFIITDVDGVRALAELGVVFLLFMIGLELSFERLWSMRRLVFGFGTAQIIVTGTIIALIAIAWGNPTGVAIVLGACLALSSTAIVVQLLVEKRRLGTPVGRVTFSVLLMQDLAVVPILFAVGVVGTTTAGANLGLGLSLALLKAIAVIGVIYIAGRLLLRPVLRFVAQTQRREAFMAIVLLIVVGTAAVTGLAGLSMALGAFLAGLLIAETEFRHQVEIDIEPFKGLMLGLFFMSVGMGIDWRTLGDQPLLIAASVIGLIALKATLNILLGLMWRLPKHQAVETGLLLAQAGEFAFIVVGLAISLALLPVPIGQFMLIVAGLSMLLTPAMASAAGWLGRKIDRRISRATLEMVALEGSDLEGHIVLAGIGRVGRVIAAVMDREKIPYIAIDSDPQAVAQAQEMGIPVRFGDASRVDVLHAANVANAAALVITIGDHSKIYSLTKQIRSAAPNVPLYVRARDPADAEQLRDAGATVAIPETVEASLQLATRVLGAFGIQEAIAQRRVQEERDRLEMT